MAVYFCFMDLYAPQNSHSMLSLSRNNSLASFPPWRHGQNFCFQARPGVQNKFLTPPGTWHLTHGFLSVCGVGARPLLHRRLRLCFFGMLQSVYYYESKLSPLLYDESSLSWREVRAFDCSLLCSLVPCFLRDFLLLADFSTSAPVANFFHSMTASGLPKPSTNVSLEGSRPLLL